MGAFPIGLAVLLMLSPHLRKWGFAILALSILLIAMLALPIGQHATSLLRLAELDPKSELGLAHDARWAHWMDATRVCWAYLPFGTGLGAYGYAYLPFQESGNGAWYLHADNLWLEIGVTQGIPGVVAVIVCCGIVCKGLIHLSDSAQPMDHGLLTIGWYSVGVLLATQLFDFGLLLPANFTFYLVVAGAVAARATVDRNELPAAVTWGICGGNRAGQLGGGCPFFGKTRGVTTS